MRLNLMPNPPTRTHTASLAAFLEGDMGNYIKERDK